MACEGIAKGLVNSVNPGPIESRLMDSPGPGAGNAQKAKQPSESAIVVGHYATPEEVAALVAFLASDDARCVNGAIYTVDRGYTAI
jgi:NAD(P)-dependent dehydrogenase (short-subunit alcohol dehydrogenase family)